MKEYVREWKGRQIRTRWISPDELPKDTESPITQASGICFTGEGKVLLIREKNGNWHLPGGKPEKGEDLKQTVSREILEEACVKIDKCSLMGFSEIFFPGNPNKSEGNHFFQARLACSISEADEMRPDPATGILFERKFVDPQEFRSHLKWQDADDLLSLGLKEFDKFKEG